MVWQSSVHTKQTNFQVDSSVYGFTNEFCNSSVFDATQRIQPITKKPEII